MLKRSVLVLASWACFACAHAPEPMVPEAPVPGRVALDEPEPADSLTEAEVRAFLGAEAEEERADRLADEVIGAGDGTLGMPRDVDPADFDIPLVSNERVEFWMDYFQNRHREHFARYLSRMGRYEPLIREKLRARGMPEDLVYLALIESGFSPVARSHASAVGMWQFITGTARRYGLEVSRYLDERRDPIRATDAALDYLQDLHDRFGSWYLAAAAYNTGENRVERLLRNHADGARGDDSLYWRISRHLPSETRNYVPKLIAAAIIAKYPDRYGFGDVVPEVPETFDFVTVPDATDLSVIAEAAGVSTKEIEALNPQFLRGVTPPGRKVRVRVPAGRAEAFAVAYARIPPDRRVRVLEHVVAKGETLSHIARRYRTTVAALMETNKIRDPKSLQVGRRLIVSLGPGASAATAARSDAEPTSTTRATAVAARKDDAGPRTYRVRKGDTLWSIARNHGISIDQLRAWNRLGADSRIIPGQELVVRSGEEVIVYRVQPGDTLWGIARRHGLTADRLMEWNRMSEDVVLRPGDEVLVPVPR